jgi:mannose-1-phosphate guanylyltransferase
MKALVLAAGLGIRLRDIAPNTPKPLMEIDGVPLLKITIEKLFKLGVSDIIINTHYLHQQIADFVSQQTYRDKIELVFEPELLGTAGTLKKNLSKLEDNDFFVMHGDNYFSDSLQKLLSHHHASRDDVIVSMGTFRVDDPKDFGTLNLNGDSIMTEYFEKNPKSVFRTANSAIYIMKPSIKKLLQDMSVEENDISRDLIPKLVNRILTVPLDGFFVDIGTPENYNIARNLRA